ncbi:hypothetical protein ACO0RG_001186 [Hanseniaspora osmophila]
MEGNKHDQLGSLKSATSLTTSVNSKDDLKKNSVSNMTMETVIVEMPKLKINSKNDKSESIHSNDQSNDNLQQNNSKTLDENKNTQQQQSNGSQVHPYQTRKNSLDSNAPSSLGIIDNRSHSSLSKSFMTSPTRQFFGTHLEDPIYEEDNEDTDDNRDEDGNPHLINNGGYNSYNEYNEDDTLEDPLDLDGKINRNIKYDYDTHNNNDPNIEQNNIHPISSNNTTIDINNDLVNENSVKMNMNENDVKMNMNENENESTTLHSNQLARQNSKLIDVNPLSSFHSHPSTSTLHNKSSSLLISEDGLLKGSYKPNKDGKNELSKMESSKQRKDGNNLSSKDSHQALKSVVSNEVVSLNPDLNILRHVGSSATMPALLKKSSDFGDLSTSTQTNLNSGDEEMAQQTGNRALRGTSNRQDSIQSTNSLNITKNRSSINDYPNEVSITQQNEKMAHPKPLSRMPSSIVPTTTSSSSNTDLQSSSDATQPTNNIHESQKNMQSANKTNLIEDGPYTRKLENTNNNMNNKTSMQTLSKKQSTINEKLHSRNSTSLLGRDTSMSSANLEDKSKLNAVSSSSLVIPTDKISTSIVNPTKNARNAKNLRNGSQKNEKDENIDINKILANRTDFFAAKLASATNEKIKSNDDNDEDFVYEDLMIGHNSHDALAHTAMVKNALKGTNMANINGINHGLDKNTSQLNVEATPSEMTTSSTIAAPMVSSDTPANDNTNTNLNTNSASVPVSSQTHGTAQPKLHSTPGNISHQSSVIIDPTKLMVSQQSSQQSLKMKPNVSQELHHQTTLEKLTSKGNQVSSNFPQKLNSKGISSKLSAPVLNATGPNSAASKRLASAAAARHASIGPGPIPQRNSLVNTTGTSGVFAPNSTKQLPGIEKISGKPENQEITSTSPKKKTGHSFKKQASRNSIAEGYQERAQSNLGNFNNHPTELQPEPFGIVNSHESKTEGASSPTFLQGEFRPLGQNHTSNYQPSHPQLRTTASRMFGKHSTASSIKRHVPKDVNLEDYIDELQDSEYDILTNSHNNDSARFQKNQLFNETLSQFQGGSGANTNFKTRNGVKNLDQKLLQQRGVASVGGNFSPTARDHGFGNVYATDQSAEPINSRHLDHNDDESDTRSEFFYRSNHAKPKKNSKQQLKQFKRLSQSSVGSFVENDLQPPNTNSVFPGRRIFTDNDYEHLGAQSYPNALDDNKPHQSVNADDMDSFYTIGDNFVNDHEYDQHRNNRYSYQSRNDNESDTTDGKELGYVSETCKNGNSKSLRGSQWEAMDQFGSYVTPDTTSHIRNGMSPSHYIADGSDEEDDMHSTSDLNMYFDSLDDEPRAIANHEAPNFTKYGSIGSNLNKNVKGNNILPEDGKSPSKVLLQPRFQTGNYSSAANNMFSPHNYKKRVRKNSIWYKFRNFVYFVFIITSLLVLGFICGFFLASNKDLQSFDLSKIDNILSTNDELLFDIIAVALNAGLFTISISDVELDIFAESKYTSSIPDDDNDGGENLNVPSKAFPSWTTASALDKNMNKYKERAYDDVDSEPWETILLGTVYSLEEPLQFRGTFFKRDFDISGSSIKLKNPGLPDSLPPPPAPAPSLSPSSTTSLPLVSTSSSTTTTRNASSEATKKITSTLSPSKKTLHHFSSMHLLEREAVITPENDVKHELSSNPYEKYEQWKRLNKYEYNLIIRGKAYYRIPFFQNEKYIGVQQEVVVNAGKKRKP